MDERDFKAMNKQNVYQNRAREQNALEFEAERYASHIENEVFRIMIEMAFENGAKWQEANKQLNTISFKDFINKTELSTNDKNLVKGVYAGWQYEQGKTK